jgi:hypothetical protein
LYSFEPFHKLKKEKKKEIREWTLFLSEKKRSTKLALNTFNCFPAINHATVGQVYQENTN